MRRRLRGILMLRPSRTIGVAGDPRLSVEIIVAAFAADGFRLASEPGQFPVRLKSGSAFLDIITENEYLLLLRASRVFRKRATPVDVLIHHLRAGEEPTELLVEMRTRGGSSGYFTPDRFEKLLAEALEQLRAQGMLRSVGELEDAAGCVD